MPRRRSNPAPLCRQEFIGDADENDPEESEEESEASESYENEESAEFESEFESDGASNVDEEFEEEPPRRVKSAPPPPPPAPWHEATLTIKYTGSPQQLATDPNLATKGVPANCGLIFEGDKDVDPMNPGKKSAKHQIGGITIVRFKNDHLVSLSLGTNLIPSEKQRSHDTSGNSGIFTMFPTSKANSLNEEVCGQIGNAENNLLSRYSGYTFENLEDNITHVKGQDYSLIPKGHPLIEAFNQNGRTSGVRPMKQLDDSIKANTPDTIRLIEAVKRETQEKVKGVNLYDAKFTIQRAFVPNSADGTDGESWTAEEEIFDNIQLEKNKQNFLDTVKSCYVTLKIKYRPL